MVKITKITKNNANKEPVEVKKINHSKKKKEERTYSIPMNNRKINVNDVLIYFDKKYDGDWDKIFNAISSKEPVSSEEEAVKIANEQLSKYDITTLMDDDYPIKYRLSERPPFVIKRRKK